MIRTNDIGQHIAKIRVMRRLTQDATIARMQRLGKKEYRMTIYMLKNIETGRTNISHWQIRGLRKVFGCTYEDIFHGPQTSAEQIAAFLKAERRDQ